MSKQWDRLYKNIITVFEVFIGIKFKQTYYVKRKCLQSNLCLSEGIENNHLLLKICLNLKRKYYVCISIKSSKYCNKVYKVQTANAYVNIYD